MASISGNVTVAGDPDDWIACAFDADTHAFAGVVGVSGGTYEITGLTAGKAYVVACRPKSGNVWIPDHSDYAISDYAIPIDESSQAYLFKSTDVTIGDAFFDNVTAIIPCNGTNNSTTFTDVKGNSVTSQRDAKITTSEYKFGDSSGIFDGNGDRIRVGSSADFAWGTDDFTVEFFIRFDEISNTRYFASSTYFPSAYFYFKITSGYKISVLGSGFPELVQTGAITPLTWVHIAYVRTAGTIKLFINGIEEDSDTSSGNFSSAQYLYFGGADDNLVSEPDFCTCHINDIRITNAARYTEGFSVPTTASPQNANQPTGSEEPSWPLTVGNTVEDGGVTWTNMGQLVQPLMQGPLIAA